MLKEMVYTLELKLFQLLGRTPKLWIRFIDIFIMDTFDNLHPDIILNNLNNLYPNIHVTSTLAKNTETTNFLDISIQINRGHLQTGLYRKPTHCGSVLDFYLHHADSFKYSVAVGQFKRVKTLSNTTETQELSFNIIRETLRSSHYPEYFIEKSFDQATNKNNSSTNKTTKINKKLNYITLSLPYANKISEIYTKRIIKRLGFQNIIRSIFKSELTIGKMLFKSKLLDITQTSTDNSIIRPICKFCKLAVTNCVCNTTNIIYKLTCICGDEYVGETSKEAQIRANQHLKALMDKKPELSSFAKHYITKHNLLSNSLINDTNPFTLPILYKCNSYLDRKIREAMFIKQLKSKLNKNIGLYLTS